MFTAVRVLAADPAHAQENVANTFRRVGPTALLSLCLAFNLASGAIAGTLYGLSTDTGGVGDLLIRVDPNTAEVTSTISLTAKTLGSPQGQNWDFPTNTAFAPSPSNVSVPEPPSSLHLGFDLVAMGVIANLSSMRRRPAWNSGTVGNGGGVRFFPAWARRATSPKGRCSTRLAAAARLFIGEGWS